MEEVRSGCALSWDLAPVLGDLGKKLGTTCCPLPRGVLADIKLGEPVKGWMLGTKVDCLPKDLSRLVRGDFC